jgi:exodeoxyribonuclease VII small subunit
MTVKPVADGHRPKISVIQNTMAKTSSLTKTTAPANYEAALEELESLVASLESGQLPLDQLLTGYQRGAELLKFCRDKLTAVENQIKVLDGGELKPWNQE